MLRDMDRECTPPSRRQESKAGKTYGLLDLQNIGKKGAFKPVLCSSSKKSWKRLFANECSPEKANRTALTFISSLKHNPLRSCRGGCAPLPSPLRRVLKKDEYS